MAVAENTYEEEILSYRQQLYERAVKLTGGNIDFAKDLAQETIYKALNKKSLYNNDNMGGWLNTILRNTFINHIRRLSNRMTARDYDETAFLNSGEQSGYRQPDVIYNADELWDIVNGLDEAHRKPLLMFLEGYLYKEISDELSVPIGTVKSRINKAKKRVKEKYIS